MSNEVSVRVARPAMGTRFEILLYGGEESRLRAAGEEALDEIERLDRLLSAFRPDSAISRLNSQAADRPVRVEAELFRLLQTSVRLWEQTEGLFDITIAPLMRCWGFREPRDGPPAESEIAAARVQVGSQHLLLDIAERTVAFARPGLQLDLGGIGKGWALDEAAALLRELGISSALLHGGTSTVCAIGTPQNEPFWKIALRPPPPDLLPGGEPWPEQFLQEIELADSCLSVSAVSGRMVAFDGSRSGHVLHPVEGHPVQGNLLAAVTCSSATASDGLSTALLAGGPPLAERVTSADPQLRCLLLHLSDTEARLLNFGC